MAWGPTCLRMYNHRSVVQSSAGNRVYRSISTARDRKTVMVTHKWSVEPKNTLLDPGINLNFNELLAASSGWGVSKGYWAEPLTWTWSSTSVHPIERELEAKAYGLSQKQNVLTTLITSCTTYAWAERRWLSGSQNGVQNGVFYDIITSQNRPGLPDFSCAYVEKHGKAWVQGYHNWVWFAHS